MVSPLEDAGVESFDFRIFCDCLEIIGIARQCRMRFCKNGGQDNAGTIFYCAEIRLGLALLLL